MTKISPLVDYKIGWGGRFGVQRDRQDAAAHGWDQKEALAKHESQNGRFTRL